MAAAGRSRRGRLVLVDTTTGEVVERKERVAHAFDGKGYTLEGHGVEVPSYSLNLSGTEWDVIDWMKQHNGCSSPVIVAPEKLAAELCSGDTAIKKAVSRLLRLNLLIRIGGPRSGTYQLNPRRFWEGGGEAHVKAHLLLDPPPITADAKAQAAALKAASKAVDAARSAADAAGQVEATALAGSKPAATARTTAQTAQASAILAAETAIKLGAKLPLQIRRYLQEVDA
ncbi:MarR family transcriptional regulator [Streptomyces baarnensis]|uniref:MarR family transcriptional regulator n=1 Tax=Streptomyces baarnensis TaxID=66872 RepID=UPI003081CC2A